MNEHKVIVALGSNTNAASNIEQAKFLLRKLMPGIVFSGNLITEPVGIVSDEFTNCLGVSRSVHKYVQLHRALKSMESDMGSGKAERTRGIVRIDIDILYFNGDKYHLDDWNRPYIKQLLLSMGEENLI